MSAFPSLAYVLTEINDVFQEPPWKSNHLADALSRWHGLLTTMHTKVLGFASFAELYPTDPLFGRVYKEAE